MSRRPSTGIDWAQSAIVAKRIERIERAFGPGETLAPRERAMVLDGVLPAWLYAGARGLRGTELGERCAKALTVLEGLHGQVEPELQALGKLPPR
jgi:hypothetical protein